ncbi:MAG: isopeptide-forming domain-containing fimbrial protein [Atopobiaceae bacterium]|nr:isopeptide-forming domain-containing fimbrial protein [Atopobiaceae bacterium]
MRRTNSTPWSQRAASFALAGVLALSAGAVTAGLLPTPALAVDGSVTITQQANPDAKYDLYRIFTADIDGENNATNIKLDASVDKGALVTFLNDHDYQTWLAGKDAEAGQNLLEFISTQIDGSAGLGENPEWVDDGTFADAFAEWVTANVGAATATVGKDEAFTGPEGYYLILTNKDSLSGSDVATSPIWFPLGGKADSVMEKAKPVTITKEVQEDSEVALPGEGWKDVADAEIGQEVPYRITVSTPANYNAYTTFKMEVTDTLPGGMTMSEDDVKVHLDSATGTDVTSSFTISYDDETKALTVSCADTKKIPGLGANGKVVVTYTAKLTSLDDAQIVYGGAGNENKAVYRFSNNPDSDTMGEISDTAKLYVYMVTVDKFDKVTQEALEGAQFVIQNAEGKFLKDGAWVGTSQDEATVFTTDEDGAIDGIKGLDAGTYTLIEIKAPDGYVTPTGDAAKTQITVTATYSADGSIDEFTGEATGLGTLDGEETNRTAGTVGIDVANDKNISLAMTGAEGVGIGGAVVVAVGLGWYLVRRHRMSADQA